jgi:hypothetical protein
MQMESMTYETYVTTLEQAIGTENNENGIGLHLLMVQSFSIGW